MEIEAWYSNNFESLISGRYVTLEHIKPLLKKYDNYYEISILGVSELGKEIPMIKIGSGKRIVLAWSQMHGNESTTTKTIFDFLKFVTQKDDFKDEIKSFLNDFTLYVIPILNPDGASLYTRNNANNIDLNREAQDLSQNESRVLMNAFNKLKPNLCLNLHGQRSIFGLETKKPATVSFLSPSSNMDRKVTDSRRIAMELIVGLNEYLQKLIPGQVGRYYDSFNANCFGDAFQMKGVPVILFEAGHLGDDYRREKTRAYLFYAFVNLFGITKQDNFPINYKKYFLIPENKKNYYDYILRNVLVNDSIKPTSIAIQFTESLENETIKFIPKIAKIGGLDGFYGHLEKDGDNSEILVNSQNNIEIGLNVFIINNKNDKSLIYFNENNFLL
ncbi:MAG: DUF2817 domain-containing protein [Flavobacteriaceae bacterium]|nr:DUF2817 domain-containing protein [Flavobacteriaceae bacterium]MBT6705164.1 DUF2817 domain-containing protein [Flavobacteriaceae bacterium]MBT7241879.1 DUF2817 domain-containing protein [Flavobacteriaceae bacterium]